MTVDVVDLEARRVRKRPSTAMGAYLSPLHYCRPEVITSATVRHSGPELLTVQFDNYHIRYELHWRLLTSCRNGMRAYCIMLLATSSGWLTRSKQPAYGSPNSQLKKKGFQWTLLHYYFYIILPTVNVKMLHLVYYANFYSQISYGIGSSSLINNIFIIQKIVP
jgi:hypothetical protein